MNLANLKDIAPGRILEDNDHDQQLRREGFVVIDLLNSAEVADLLSSWSEISKSFSPTWDPTGLAATVRHPGPDEAAHEQIFRVVECHIQAVTADRTTFMSSFLVKAADSNELPPHLDWRLVSEPGSLTHGCWVALQDMTLDTGALGVVPRSHLLVDFDRTPEAPGHVQVSEILGMGLSDLLLPLGAGQAVFYDHRLIHYSEANKSDRNRLAINLGVSSREDAPIARARLMQMMERGVNGLGVASQFSGLGSENTTDPDELGAPEPIPHPTGILQRVLTSLRLKRHSS